MGFHLSHNPLPDHLFESSNESGAVVTFVGRVRRMNEGRSVASLRYEAYEELATREGDKVLQEAMRQFPILGAECAHRIGHLQLQEKAIVVQVAAAHRREAFEACEWIVNEIKSRVPIWKKEFYEDGESIWIDPTATPR